MSKSVQHADVIKQMTQAFEWYLAGLKPNKIAEKVCVSVSQVRSWIKTEGWTERKQAIIGLAFDRLHDRYGDELAELQFGVMKEFLELVNLQTKNLRFRMVGPEGEQRYLEGKELLELSRAMKAAWDVASQASGLDGKRSSPEKPGNAKRPKMITGEAVVSPCDTESETTESESLW